MKKQWFWGVVLFASLAVMLLAGAAARKQTHNSSTNNTDNTQTESVKEQTPNVLFPADENTPEKPSTDESPNGGTAALEENADKGNGEAAGNDVASGNAEKETENPAEVAESKETEDIKTDEAATEPDDTEMSSDSEPMQPEEETEPDLQDKKLVAFTFDDGPFTPVTTRILKVLADYKMSATFFVVGDRLDLYKDTLRLVYDGGHEIASHTWSHPNLNKLSAAEVEKEIGDTATKIYDILEINPPLVRPPYGNANETVREVIDVPLINWSLDSEDWKTKDRDHVINHILDTIKDGDIILMHDLYECTAEAVEYLVPELISRGFHIVSVSELYRLKGQELIPHKIHRTPREQ